MDKINGKYKTQKLLPLLCSLIAATQASSSLANENCEVVALYTFDQITDWYGGISDSIGQNYDVGKYLTDELFRITPDGLVSGVVNEINVNPSSQKATLHVNTNCHWSNGRQITSHDIKAGLLTVLNPKSSGMVPIEGIVKNGEKVKSGEMSPNELEISAIDDLTLEFDTELGEENLKIQLTDALVIPLPHWLVAEDPDYPFRDSPPEVYSGPYMVKNYDPINMEILLEHNPYYCGVEPDFKTLRLKGRATNESFLAYAAKDENVIVFFPEAGYTDADKLRSLDWVNEEYYLDSTTRSHIGFYRLNARRGAFVEPELRDAFLMGIDWRGPAGLYTRIDKGSGEYLASVSLLPSEYMPDAPKFERHLEEREERLATARSTLAEFGYNDGNPLILKAAIAEYQNYYFYPMKEMIEAGLPIQIEETVFENLNEYYEKVHLSASTQYDISLAEWGTPTPSPLFYINFYFHNNTTPAAITEAGKPYIDIIRHSSNSEEIQKAKIDALNLLYREQIFIPVFERGFPYFFPKTAERRERIEAPLGVDLARKDKSTCNL